MWGNSATYIWSSIMSSPPPLPLPLPLPLPPRPPPVRDVDVNLSTAFWKPFLVAVGAPPWLSPSRPPMPAPNLRQFAAVGERSQGQVGWERSTEVHVVPSAELHANSERKGRDAPMAAPDKQPLPPDRHGPRRCGTNKGTTLRGMTPRRHEASGQCLTSVFKSTILKAPAAPPPSSTSISAPRAHRLAEKRPKECFW